MAHVSMGGRWELLRVLVATPRRAPSQHGIFWCIVFPFAQAMQSHDGKRLNTVVVPPPQRVFATRGVQARTACDPGIVSVQPAGNAPSTTKL